MSAKVRFILCALIFALFVPMLSGDDQEKRSKDIMRRKLTHAQRILEGLAINDCESIVKNAQELMLLSKANEWRVLGTPRYELHSNEFRRAIDNIVEKAKEKNLDGAALGYVELTLSCVRCHKYVRDVKMTRSEQPPGGWAVAVLDRAQ